MTAGTSHHSHDDADAAPDGERAGPAEHGHDELGGPVEHGHGGAPGADGGEAGSRRVRELRSHPRRGRLLVPRSGPARLVPADVDRFGGQGHRGQPAGRGPVGGATQRHRPFAEGDTDGAGDA